MSKHLIQNKIQNKFFFNFVLSILFNSLFQSNLFANEFNLSKNENITKHEITSESQHAMVVTDQALASQVGIDILKAGGNAVDAAVAIAYALSVVQPCCGNLGGGGFLLLRTNKGENIFINFREKAPIAAKENMFQKVDGSSVSSVEGFLAVAVPGTVLGLETALNKYGTLSREQVIKPAILLAEQGYILREGDIELLKPFTETFRKYKNVANIFLKNNQPYQIGDRLIQKDLSKTLKLISNEGAQVFYQGTIAEEIVNESIIHGGILSLKDFSNYSIEELQPIQCEYRDHQIISAPLPSSGGVAICEMLNILENYPLNEWNYATAKTKHVIIDAMRFAFLDRQKLGDANFVDNPIQCLLSIEHAKDIVKQILPDKASKIIDSSNVEFKEKKPAGQGCTTHFSVQDKDGNIVSLTYTLNSLFGAKVIAGQTGFFLNNEMDDFSMSLHEKNQFGLVQGVQNSIQPGKRPLSSMAPTIVLKKDKPFLILGAAGGPKIISTNLLTLLQVIDFKIPLKDAVNAPRFHHQFLPDVLQHETNAFLPLTHKELQKMGYKLEIEQGLTGVEESIMIDASRNLITGVSDKRRAEGKALGY